MQRSSWGSRIGFIFAVVGSAVGLANIWRFPYIVGHFGGGAFVIVYLLCLLLIGYPVLIAELLIGREGQLSPGGSFLAIGRRKAWGMVGKLTVLTGFLVSSFYSAVAGWILGYLAEAIFGRLTSFESTEQASLHFKNLTGSPLWAVGMQGFFLMICVFVLYRGVRDGIEKCNKFMMPLLFAVLIFLVIRGLFMPNAFDALTFLFKPDLKALTPIAILTALGQSFFTLSLGQGTMVTYGSYLEKKESLVGSSFPIVMMDTTVSLLSAIAVFSIVFSVGLHPDSGPGLLFETLPWVFSQVPGGWLLAILFFLLVLFAAVTSQISAMEPTISYLIDEWNATRHLATLFCGAGVFLLGLPSALSFNLLGGSTVFGLNFLDFMTILTNSILIPLGGFAAIVLVGWWWGAKNALQELERGSEDAFIRHSWLKSYFRFCFRFSAPVLILLVFLNALGLF